MKTLGIDLGTKTIGVAISDDIGLTAHGIETITRTDLKHDLAKLQKLLDEYKIKKIIVGLPRNMNGSLGKSAQQVFEFIEKLKKAFAIPVDTWDERLSSVEAERLLIHADMSRQKRRKVIDKVAASIILQGYLDYTNKKCSQ